MPGGEASRGGVANHATMFFTVSPRADVDDAMALAAYARASAYLEALPPGPAPTPGYRLFWVRGDEIGHKDLGEADYAVVGRHSACDVALSQASELSLRHILIASAKLDDGAHGLRILDLRASLPFYTDDGRPRRSIAASGPVVLRLGTYMLGGVPLGPDLERPLLPAEMPRAIVTDALSSGSSLDGQRVRRTPRSEGESTMGGDGDDFFDPPPKAAPPPQQQGSALLSRVTVVPNAALLTEVIRMDAPLAFARLTLLREGHSASIDLHTSDLDAGVLIGRSERCTDGGLRRVLDGNISRIHVMLLREGEDVLAYDLCSTQGTYDNGESVRRRRLSRAGGCISLAKTNPVMLCLQPRADSPAADGEPLKPDT